MVVLVCYHLHLWGLFVSLHAHPSVIPHTYFWFTITAAWCVLVCVCPTPSQLLSALPQLPALTTLCLHSATGPRWVAPSSQLSATPPPPGATITPNELRALARATSLSRLEVHTLSLPGPNDRQTADLTLPNLRSLATYNLHTSHRQGADRLGSLFPALTNLSLGACPHSSQSEAAGLTASEAGARAATEVAVASAAAKGDGPLSEAALLSAPALLPVLTRLSNLERLDLGPVSAAVMAKELTQGAVPLVSLPCLRWVGKDWGCGDNYS